MISCLRVSRKVYKLSKGAKINAAPYVFLFAPYAFPFAPLRENYAPLRETNLINAANLIRSNSFSEGSQDCRSFIIFL